MIDTFQSINEPNAVSLPSDTPPSINEPPVPDEEQKTKAHQLRLRTIEIAHQHAATIDPDELEEQLEEAREDDDYKPLHHSKPAPRKKK